MSPTKAMELAHVDELARCAIGLASVKEHFAFEAHRLHHEFAQFADGKFLARTYVDVAVTDFTEFRDGSATACAVVTVNCTIDTCAVMHAGILFNADNVAEIHVQEHMYRGVRHVFAPKELAKRLASTPKGHLVILDAVLGEDFQNFILGGVAVDAFDGALVHVNLNTVPVVIVDEFRQVNFTHHGRHHMAVFKMEVVIGAVEVRRHHSEIVGAVLQVVAFAHLEASNLCDGVFLVGVLEFAREEGILLHGLRCVFRIDAGRAEEQELLHVVSVCFAEHVALDFHVHHHEIGTIERVRHNATHESSSEHHGIRSFLVKKLLNGVLVSEVKFFMGTTNQVVVPTGFQIIPNG